MILIKRKLLTREEAQELKDLGFVVRLVKSFKCPLALRLYAVLVK